MCHAFIASNVAKHRETIIREVSSKVSCVRWFMIVRKSYRSFLLVETKSRREISALEMTKVSRARMSRRCMLEKSTGIPKWSMARIDTSRIAIASSVPEWMAARRFAFASRPYFSRFRLVEGEFRARINIVGSAKGDNHACFVKCHRSTVVGEHKSSNWGYATFQLAEGQSRA